MSYYGNKPYQFDGETPNKNPRSVWPPHGQDRKFGEGYGDDRGYGGGSKVPAKPKKPLPGGSMGAMVR